MKYPKINTIFKRDEFNNHRIIEGDLSCPEFDAIKLWSISEKIDGFNCRVIFTKEQIVSPIFCGRTDDAIIPNFVLDYLKNTFSQQLFIKQFPDANMVILFGECYGNKIQSVGKHYRSDNSFILFDAFIDGFWLEPYKVKCLALELGIDYVPELGIMSNDEAIALVKKGFESKISIEPLIAEGIVARSFPLMLFRDGTPIMWKLKFRDYIKKNKVD